MRIAASPPPTMSSAPDWEARNIKRSLSIAGHRTSITLEEPFWRALKDIAREENISLATLAARIDGERKQIGLSSALRLYVLRRLQER